MAREYPQDNGDGTYSVIRENDDGTYDVLEGPTPFPPEDPRSPGEGAPAPTGPSGPRGGQQYVGGLDQLQYQLQLQNQLYLLRLLDEVQRPDVDTRRRNQILAELQQLASQSGYMDYDIWNAMLGAAGAGGPKQYTTTNGRRTLPQMRDELKAAGGADWSGRSDADVIAEYAKVTGAAVTEAPGASWGTGRVPTLDRERFEAELELARQRLGLTEREMEERRRQFDLGQASQRQQFEESQTGYIGAGGQSWRDYYRPAAPESGTRTPFTPIEQPPRVPTGLEPGASPALTPLTQAGGVPPEMRGGTTMPAYGQPPPERPPSVPLGILTQGGAPPSTPYQQMVDWWTQQANAGRPPGEQEWVDRLVQLTGVTRQQASEMYQRGQRYKQITGQGRPSEAEWMSWLRQVAPQRTIGREQMENQQQQYWASLMGGLTGPRDWMRYQIAQSQVPEDVWRRGGGSLMDLFTQGPASGAMTPTESWQNAWRNAGGGKGGIAPTGSPPAGGIPPGAIPPGGPAAGGRYDPNRPWISPPRPPGGPTVPPGVGLTPAGGGTTLSPVMPGGTGAPFFGRREDMSGRLPPGNPLLVNPPASLGLTLNATPEAPQFTQPNQIAPWQFNRMRPTQRAMMEGQWSNAGIDPQDAWRTMQSSWLGGQGGRRTTWR